MFSKIGEFKQITLSLVTAETESPNTKPIGIILQMIDAITHNPRKVDLILNGTETYYLQSKHKRAPENSLRHSSIYLLIH